MASVVGICNSALVKLGVGSEGRIASLTEGTKNANICLEQYEKRRDRLLRSHFWNFAIGRVQLARLSAAPAFGFDFQYQLPTDYLRVVRAYDNDSGVGRIIYKLEGSALLADVEEVFLRYVRKITDPAAMTSDFQEYLAADLAHEMAYAITQSNSVKAEMKADRLVAKRAARSIDAMEDVPEQFPEGSWIVSRRRGSGGLWRGGVVT